MAAHQNLRPKSVMLIGPTASGKTSLAMQLCDLFPFEIISIDSAQVYQDMDIGSAKPSPDELIHYPHHLINLISPAESYSTSQFRDDASDCMQKITQAGKIPLLVGGSMLYAKTLLAGLDNLPSADVSLRSKVAEEANLLGWEEMHAKLKKIDYHISLKIKPSDSQRIQRALEVYYLTKQLPSSIYQENKTKFNLDQYPYDLLFLACIPERSHLHNNIQTRFKDMLTKGLVDEVKMLKQKYPLHAELPSQRCIGYRQVWQMLDHVFPEKELPERGTIATRQFAKRQITWLNGWFIKNLPLEHLNQTDPNTNLKKAIHLVKKHLLA